MTRTNISNGISTLGLFGYMYIYTLILLKFIPAFGVVINSIIFLFLCLIFPFAYIYFNSKLQSFWLILLISILPWFALVVISFSSFI